MKTTKKIGVCMDYSVAHIMELSERPHEIATIESDFSPILKSKENKKGEKYLCSLAEQCKEEYFKNIASAILQYKKVLIFGPTDAKKEFFHMLCEDERFFKIKTYLKESGRMTLNQRNRFIKNHFLTPVYH